MDNMSDVGRTAGFSAGGFLLGILLGAVVGGVTALLLAPKSGAETREMMMNRFNQAKDVVRSTAQDVKKTGQEMREQVR